MAGNREKRLSNKYVEVYLGGTKLLTGFGGTVYIDPTMLEVSGGWENTWGWEEPDKVKWHAEIKKHCIYSNFADFVALAAQTATAETPLTFAAYHRAGDSSSLILEGPCWAGSASIGLDDGNLTEESIDFRPAGPPTRVGNLMIT